MVVVTEVPETTVVAVPERSPGVARLEQVIDYLFWLAYTLLLIRFVLVLFNANAVAGFAQFVRGVTDPLFAPFRGIVPNETLEGGYTLAVPILVALLVYGLLQFAIHRLLRLIAYRRTIA